MRATNASHTQLHVWILAECPAYVPSKDGCTNAISKRDFPEFGKKAPHGRPCQPGQVVVRHAVQDDHREEELLFKMLGCFFWALALSYLRKVDNRTDHEAHSVVYFSRAILFF